MRRELINRIGSRPYLVLSVLMVLFLALRLKLGVMTPIFDIEEVGKLGFLTESNNPFSLLLNPLQYDHPPLYRFVLSLGALIFGKSITSIRVIMLGIAMLSAAASFFAIRKLYDDTTAFLSTALLLFLPMFVVQSNYYSLEISSLGLFYLALLYFCTEKWSLYALWSSAAFLVIESHLSLQVSCLFFYLLSYRKSLNLKDAFFVSLPLLISFIYLFSTYLISGKVANHSMLYSASVSEQIHHMLFARSEYSVSWQGLYDTFHENNVGNFLILFSFLLPYTLFSKRFTLSSKIIMMNSVIVVTYFILYNLFSGGRDYYVVLSGAFVTISSFFVRKKQPYAIWVLTLISMVFTTHHFLGAQHKKGSTFQSSIYEHQWHDDLVNIKKSIVSALETKKNKPFLCSPENYTSKAICYSLFGVSEPGEFEIVSAGQEPDFQIIEEPQSSDTYQFTYIYGERKFAVKFLQ